MRKLFGLLVLLVCLPISGFGQAGTYTTLRSGPTLPTSCNPGGHFFKTTAPIGTHQCIATNTWLYIPGAATSSVVGQVLRVTGANAYGFGKLDLADADSIENDLPDSFLSGNVSLLGPTIIDTEMGIDSFGHFSCDGSNNGCTLNEPFRSITYNINILSPTTGLTNMAQLYWPGEVTLLGVDCSIDAGTSVTIQFDQRSQATPNTAGTNSMTSSLVCDTNTESTVSFSDATIPGFVPHNLQITGVSGSVGVVRIAITGVLTGG